MPVQDPGARRLVDDQQRVVFVAHVEGDVLGDQPQRLRRGQFDLDAVAGLDRVTGAAQRAWTGIASA